MEFLSAMALILVGLCIGYWFGFRKGFVVNISDEILEILKDMPVNIEISQIGDMFYGRLMGLGTFIGQSKNKDDIFDTAVLKYPNRTIVISNADEEEYD